MHRKELWSLITTFILIVFCFVYVSADFGCLITTANNQVIDLTGLDQMGIFNATGTDPNLNFYFKICTQGANPNSHLCTFASQGFHYSSSYNLCYPIGVTGPRTSFINPLTEQDGVSIVHSGFVGTDGVTRILKINLACDYAMEGTPVFTFMGEKKEGGGFTYTFSGRTKYSCPPKPKVVDCTIRTTGGMVMDLSVLDQANGYVVSSSNDPSWSYYLNVCNMVNKPNTELCTKTSQGYQYSKTYNMCYPIGYGASPILTFLNPAKEREGVKVVHSEIYNTDGVGRKLELRLICDTTAQTIPTFQFIGEMREGGGVISYQFSGKTKAVCPTLPEIPKKWGELTAIDLNDYSNRIVSYGLDSFIGKPTLSVQVSPSSSIDKYLFMISDCPKNSWSSTLQIDNASFLQNYGCVSIFSQLLNQTSPVPLSLSFTQPNSDMVLVVQTSNNQELVNLDSNKTSYTVQPSSVRYNLLYSKQIKYIYSTIDLNVDSTIFQKDSGLYLTSVKIPAQSFLKLNLKSIKDIYLGKELPWSASQEVQSASYHFSKPGVQYIYSGDTSVDLKVVIIGSASFKANVIETTSGAVTGLSIALGASIFILAIVVVVSIVVIVKLRQKQTNLGDLQVRLN